MYLSIPIIIIIVLIVYYFGKDSGKASKDVKIMRQFGINSFKEQMYLVNRFGRGNITEFTILKYFIEKDEGLHPEFE